MTTRILVTISVLFWSSLGFCTNTDQEVKEYIHFLNAHYHYQIEPSTSSDAADVLKDLDTLEDVLHGTANVSVSAKGLKHIACTANECGGCGHQVCHHD